MPNDILVQCVKLPLLILKKEGHSHIFFMKKEWHSSFPLNLGSAAHLSIFLKGRKKKYPTFFNLKLSEKLQTSGFSNSSDSSRLIHLWSCK